MGSENPAQIVWPSLHIALVLKPEWRTPGGLARVRMVALTLGIEVTGIGSAAVSGTISPTLYELFFGARTTGVQTEIAPPLGDLVESVSVLPPHPRS